MHGLCCQSGGIILIKESQKAWNNQPHPILRKLLSTRLPRGTRKPLQLCDIYCLHLQGCPEHGDSMLQRNAGINPQAHNALQHIRPIQTPKTLVSMLQFRAEIRPQDLPIPLTRLSPFHLTPSQQNPVHIFRT